MVGVYGDVGVGRHRRKQALEEAHEDIWHSRPTIVAADVGRPKDMAAVVLEKAKMKIKVRLA